MSKGNGLKRLGKWRFWDLSARSTGQPRPILTVQRLEDRHVLDAVITALGSSLPGSLAVTGEVPQFTGGVLVAAGDVTGDGYADIVTGPGPGGGPHVRVFDGKSGQIAWEFMAYDPTFYGGCTVALGDVTGDGRLDLITGAGPGGGPHVKVFDGTTGAEVVGFYAFDPGFLGGVAVAAGDLDGDGFAEIVTGAGPGGGPHVKVFDGRTWAQRLSFFAYADGFRGGVNVSVGDVTGDGTGDVITGAGPGGGPHVKVFDGNTGQEAASLFAYAPEFRGGVYVAAGDVTGDGVADLLTGAGAGGGPHVRLLDGRNDTDLGGWMAYSPAFTGGASVALADFDADGRPDVVTGAGPGGGPHVRRFRSTGGDAGGFFAYTTGSTSTSSDSPSSDGGDSGGGPVTPIVPPVNELKELDFGWEQIPSSKSESGQLRSEGLASEALASAINNSAIVEFMTSPMEQRTIYSIENGVGSYKTENRIKRPASFYRQSEVTLPEKNAQGVPVRNDEGVVIQHTYTMSGYDLTVGSRDDEYLYTDSAFQGFEQFVAASHTPRLQYLEFVEPGEIAPDRSGAYGVDQGVILHYAVRPILLRASVSLVDAANTMSLNPNLIPIAKEVVFRIQPVSSDTYANYTLQIRRESNDQWYDVSGSAATPSGDIEARFTPRLPGRYFYRLKSLTADSQVVYSQPQDFVSVFPSAAELSSNDVVRNRFRGLMQETITDAVDNQESGKVRERALYVMIDTATSQYIFHEGIAGFSSSFIEDASPSVAISSYFTPDTRTDTTPNGVGIFNVATIHTHTPTQYRKSKTPQLDSVFGKQSRKTGPSEEDLYNAANSFSPAFVYDYEPVGDSGMIPIGHPATSTTSFSLIPGSKFRRGYDELIIGGPLDI